MKRMICTICTAVLVLSCAAPQKGASTAQYRESAALLAAFALEGDPAKMPDAEKVALETVAIKIAASGPGMVAPVLADIQSNRDGNRRMALVKLLAMIEDQMPSDSPARAESARRIEQSGRKLLASSDAADRYAGAVLLALPTKSELIPAALRLLEDEDAANRAFGNVVLRQIAQIDLGYNPDAPQADRAGAAKRWRQWWEENRERAFYYMPSANPVLYAITSESANIARRAGPYALEVIDQGGAPVAGAVVMYSYYFTTFDGRGQKFEQRLSTDDNGRALLGGETVVSGMKFVGAQIVVSKSGYKEVPITLSPHVLTPNSFSVSVTLEPEAR